MREIIFRGKQTAARWVYGSLFVWEETYAILSDNCVKNGMISPINVSPETVSQFTGLIDKNGKRIFEGDIVRYVYEPGKGFWNCNQNSVIKWREPGWYMEGIKGTNKYALMCGYLSTVPYVPDTNERGNIKVFEVIGNIHDNPELLDKGGT